MKITDLISVSANILLDILLKWPTAGLELDQHLLFDKDEIWNSKNQS